jgi:hypothetical protein
VIALGKKLKAGCANSNAKATGRRCEIVFFVVIDATTGEELLEGPE